MNRTATTIAVAAAFAAGCGATHLLRPALAAENISAQVIHTGELNDDALGQPNAGGTRSKMFVSADGATVSVQNGMGPTHIAPHTTAMQYILEGTGTVWLGDKQVTVKPGDLVVIPKGPPHGGTSAPLKAIAIKTPPRAPDDPKLLN